MRKGEKDMPAIEEGHAGSVKRTIRYSPENKGNESKYKAKYQIDHYFIFIAFHNISLR
jgi:hypothetical protein